MKYWTNIERNTVGYKIRQRFNILTSVPLQPGKPWIPEGPSIPAKPCNGEYQSKVCLHLQKSNFVLQDTTVANLNTQSSKNTE